MSSRGRQKPLRPQTSSVPRNANSALSHNNSEEEGESCRVSPSRVGPPTTVSLLNSSTEENEEHCIACPRGPVKASPSGALPKKLLGGIALSRANSTPTSLMPTVNLFKQLDAANKPSVPAPALRNPNSIKDALLRWMQNRVQNYPVSVTNFSSSWADGMAFCALIHRFAPDAFAFDSLSPENVRENLELAFRVAEEKGIYPLLEVEDMLIMGGRPDWKCVFTYVQQFYKQFRDVP